MDAYLETVRRIEAKIDQQVAATNANTTQVAVLSERVGNLAEKTEEHIEEDKEVHKKHAESIEKLNEWKTALVAKIGSYAAVAGFIVSVVFQFGKEALAALLQ